MQRILNPIIKLNVGGLRFDTLQSTLMHSGYFKSLLSEKQEDGSHFVDRNGRVFEYLLNFMRCGYVSIPTNSLEDVRQEAEFYQIEWDLGEAVAAQLKPELLIVEYFVFYNYR